jgi:hypothetical protein
MRSLDRLSRWIVPAFLVINTAMLIVVASSLEGFRTEVGQLREAVERLRQPRTAHSAAERHALYEGPCTRCHSEERFTRLHGTKDDLTRIIDRMKANPEARISDADADTIHAALMLLKCEQCHSGEMVEKLSLMKPEYRLNVIKEMAKKPGSQIPVEESKDILNAWERLLGF